ncbi:MAG TPA: LptF/LptG family permease [Saprospiraceae bacterium]|nr:LptF/LptG family permease [Saprospiraceae bacterium]
MIKKIDLYIIRKFLGTFFFTILLSTTIAITIDFFEKIDNFLNAEVSAWVIFTQYILTFIPWINGLLWPLFTFIAVIFFTSRMAKDSEIIPILSAGVSYYRLLVPYFVAGGFLAVLLYLGNHYLIPYSNKVKTEFENEVFKKGYKQTIDHVNIHFYINPSEKIYVRNFRTSDSLAQHFRLETFDEEGRLVKVMKTDRLKYNTPTGTWIFKGYEWRQIEGMRERLGRFPDQDLDTILPFGPDDFVRYTKQREMLSTPDLLQFINLERNRGINAAQTYLVEYHRRTSHPVTLIILTILGASIASKKVRGGMGLHIAMGVLLGALLEVLSKFSMTFSSNLGMSAFLGVWFPNIIFAIITGYLVSKAQK